MSFDTWINQPKMWTSTHEGYRIEAQGLTDLFIDPQGRSRQNNAPLFCVSIEGDFRLTCRVLPELKTMFDAGAIVVFQDGAHWVKYAYELTDLGYPCMVTVVTSDVSDDCNGEPIHDTVWMRICRKGNLWGLQFSNDGAQWKMSRYFCLNLDPMVQVGILAQSPLGEGCMVEFTGLKIEKISVSDVRTGE